MCRGQQHPVAEHVARHVADADDGEVVGVNIGPSVRKWKRTDSHAPRAVIPIFLWSYPCEPPEANASPSQNPYAFAISLATSEKVAVPLSAATTR